MSSVSWMKKLVQVIVVVVAFFLGMSFAPRHDATAQELTTRSLLTEVEQLFASVYDTVSPSVVSISVEQQRGTEFVPWSSGSGFVYDGQGHIITNSHVVDGGDRIAINFFDGTLTRAEVVGRDPDADIAVLKVSIPEDRLMPVQFGNSNNLVVGQTSLAIGSPFGQRWTLTSGIISALDRSIEGLSRYSTGAVIQTDTAINPGNSGGPLLNLQGEVIGVNTQIFSDARANSGVGFAVPSNLVRRVAGELIEFGEVNYSYLGIQGEDINLNYMERLNLPNNLRGVVITLVRSGEPAAAGGLFSDDIIIAIDDQPVISFASLIGYLSINTLPGDTVKMTVFRQGEMIDLDVLLGSRFR